MHAYRKDTLLFAESQRGYPIDLDTTLLLSEHFHQGLWLDRELGTGMYHNRARAYAPELGRFLQRDPNETAQMLFTAMVMNAQSRMAALGLGAGGQFVDGMSLYQYLSSNPNRGLDPAGLYDPFADVDDAIMSLYADGAAFGLWAQEKIAQFGTTLLQSTLTAAAFGIVAVLAPPVAVAGGLALSAVSVIDGIRSMWHEQNITFWGTAEVVGGIVGVRSSGSWLRWNAGNRESWGMLGRLTASIGHKITGVRAKYWSVPRRLKPQLSFPKVGKLIQHAPDWNLPPTHQSVAAMKQIAMRIWNNATDIRQGPWHPKGGGHTAAIFASNGRHVIVARPDGNMITILKNATGNKWFNQATDIMNY